MKLLYLFAFMAVTTLCIPSIVDARSLRAVGSSTVFPFAKAAAEYVARAHQESAMRFKHDLKQMCLVKPPMGIRGRSQQANRDLSPLYSRQP